MSAVIKTLTPFINKELLLMSLNEIGCKYTLHENEILTERIDYQGKQKFVLQNNRYIFQHDSHSDNQLWKIKNFKEQRTISGFLEAIEEKYHFFYKKKLEEEQIKLENERKAFVEKQKENIIAKAKEKGYSVQEEKVKGKIKLILVRNTY